MEIHLKRLISANEDAVLRVRLFEILKRPVGIDVSNEDMKVIERLITVEKADVNARNENNWTPLLYVAARSCESWYSAAALGKLLIDNKADVNARWTYGQTPLMFTVRNLDLCKSLVENGGNLYMMSVRDTPLIYAAKYANVCGYPENHKLMKYYVNAMMKPNDSLAILILGIKRFRKSPILQLIDIHIITKVAKQIKPARRQNLRAQIEAIENKEVRNVVLSEIVDVLLPRIKIK